jgi:Amt family ammonium transporter
LAAGSYSFVVTWVLLRLTDALVGLRVSADEEDIGLDLSQHGERGYIMGAGEFFSGLAGPSSPYVPVVNHVSESKVAV